MIHRSPFLCQQELENPLILIHDKKISDMNALVRILELAVKVIHAHVTEVMLHYYYEL